MSSFCGIIKKNHVRKMTVTKAILIGNLCTFFAMIFNSVSSTRKTAKGVLWMQTVSQGVYLISAVVLRGYSAAVQNAVGIFRNIAAIRNIKSKALEWLLVGLGVILGVVFNNRGWIGLLPVIGNFQYTLAIFRFKDDERKLKFCFLLSVLAFNCDIHNYVGVVSDMFVVITTAIVLLKPQKKNDEAEEN